ncbi:hypothetical protein MDAP_000618 [Mitosporidium daphniae]|uniref:SUN domain-containing protein n=1 Tax=Mitosporidium daphniae TaxID=1485682 RepID=A0A098VUE2_9MICR|nr:uncharacterized protein DI09_15p420 [Mitosporidium daphniae]KGG52575.1 hypothetical protein DI09_15p420 [Mitosporidium daphniae]|eukprot:XP_013239002.1 uncharacterized protein DI09_15p420 [Mitosporidium daphniae]
MASSSVHSGGDSRQASANTHGHWPSSPSSHPQKNHSSSIYSGVKPYFNSSKVFSSVLKERFNFASAACAALVIHSSLGIKSPSAILSPNKDVYMLIPCTNYKSSSTLKWLSSFLFTSTQTQITNSASISNIIVELCSELRIDTIVLSNEEYFSSSFKKVGLFGSARYGAESPDWKLIANLEASPTRGPQVFNLEGSSSFVRYLRFEFESFYGHEFYCPVTFLAVYGTTMIDDLRQEIAKNPMPHSNTSFQENFRITKKADPGKETPDINEHRRSCPSNNNTSKNNQHRAHAHHRNINSNLSLLFQMLDSNKHFRTLFKAHSSDGSPLFFEKNESESSDVISGNNIFKLIIDRVGLLESQTDSLASQLLETSSELNALRHSMAKVQTWDVNFSFCSFESRLPESVTEPGIARSGYINNLYDVLKIERFVYFWNKDSELNGVFLLLLIVVFSIFINWWIFWRFSKRKRAPSSSSSSSSSSVKGALSSASSPIIMHSNFDEISALILNTPTQPSINPIMLDPEVMLFPTVDPSLTKSSLLKNNDHLLSTPTGNGCLFAPSSPKSPLLERGALGRTSSSFTRERCKFRSKSMPRMNV